jgi:hypothetical protein
MSIEPDRYWHALMLINSDIKTLWIFMLSSGRISVYFIERWLYVLKTILYTYWLGMRVIALL